MLSAEFTYFQSLSSHAFNYELTIFFTQSHGHILKEKLLLGWL